MAVGGALNYLDSLVEMYELQLEAGAVPGVIYNLYIV